MLTFHQYCEQQNQLILPPIPPGFIRLTHFTNMRTAQILLNGENFNYDRNGIQGTTDSFSNNEDVLNLIKTGKTGAFTRGSFGDAVVLMDMSNREYRIHHSFNYDSYNVPNDRIVGIVDRNNMRFIPNPNYTPNHPEITPTKKDSPKISNIPQPSEDVPVPQPRAGSSEESSDVW